jgi:hypothetical protein
MIDNHGVDQTIIFHKEILRFIQQSCMDQRTTLNQEVLPFWTSTRNGYPNFLIKDIRIPMTDLMKDIRFRQGLITVCNFYKSLKAPVSYDLSTITQVNPMSQTSEYRNLIEQISDHFSSYTIKARSIDMFSSRSDNPVFATPKASANGPNALGLSSVLDARASYESRIFKTQFEIARMVFTTQAFKDWAQLFRESLSVYKDLQINKNLITGRLHFLQEGGGKTRVICIPDIWSQSVLKPIHDYLYQVIKKLPGDGTFSHSKIGNRVRKLTKTKGLICFDLKAATDRMPVDLQQNVLKHLVGERLASLWRNLLCDRDYHVKGTRVRYSVGQPMGFLTSWATMDITHHAIIDYAKKDKSFKAVIGDDVALASKHGAKVYESILHRLGMTISYEKSVFSTDKVFLGEIAKRLFINGGEISPIPPDILIKSTGNLIGFLEFIRVFSEKFHHSDQGGFSDSEYQDLLKELFLNSNFSSDLDARVLLSCPILDDFPILPRVPPLGVTPLWNTEISKIRYLRDFEQFLLETANNRTNDKIVKDLTGRVEPAKHGKYPMFNFYLDALKKDYKQLLNRINTTYIDEEADSFAEGPIKDLRDILQFPSLYEERGNINDVYLSKRKLRLRNTHSMIQLFWEKYPFYQVRQPE